MCLTKITSVTCGDVDYTKELDVWKVVRVRNGEIYPITRSSPIVLDNWAVAEHFGLEGSVPLPPFMDRRHAHTGFFSFLTKECAHAWRKIWGWSDRDAKIVPATVRGVFLTGYVSECPGVPEGDSPIPVFLSEEQYISSKDIPCL